MEMGVFPANRDLREARARTLRARSDSDSRRRCVNCLSHTERPQDIIERIKVIVPLMLLQRYGLLSIKLKKDGCYVVCNLVELGFLSSLRRFDAEEEELPLSALGQAKPLKNHAT